MQFLRRHSKFLCVAAVFAACLFVFLVFWQLNVRSTGQKSRSIYLNDTQTATTAPVKSSIQQTFVCTEAFHAIGVLPKISGQALPGTLKLEIYDKAGTLLASAQGNAAQTASGQYAVFNFAKPVSSQSGVYQLVFTAQMANLDEYALAKSQESPAAWQLEENGKPAQGALCLLASVDAIGSFAGKFYFAFAILASVALCAIFGLAKYKKMQFHTFFVLCVCLVGLFYCFILPPYSAPNEAAHINRAFNISSGILGHTSQKPLPNTAVRRQGDTSALIEAPGTTIFTYREIVRGFFTFANQPATAVFNGDVAKGGGVFSLPAAFGLTLARLLRLGFVPSLFLGRFFSVMAFAVLGGLCVYHAPNPCSKGIFAAVGLLPGCALLWASYNTAGIVLGTAMLYTALCLKAQSLAKKSPAAFCFAFCLLVLLCTAGIYYLPFALFLPAFLPAVQALPACRQMPNGKKTQQQALKVLKTPPVFGLVLWGLFAAGMVFFGRAAYFAALQRGAKPMQGGLISGDGPLQMYIKTLLGGVLGGQSLQLNWGLTFAAAIVLLFFVLPVQNGQAPGGKTRNAAFVIAVLCGVGSAFFAQDAFFAALLSMPVLPLAMLWLAGLPFGIKKHKENLPMLLCAVFALDIFALLNAFLIIITR